MLHDTKETQPTHTHSLLSDKAILEYRNNNRVVIHPFLRENLATSSYDVTLGNFYFREQVPVVKEGDNKETTTHFYNPYSKRDVDRIWSRPFEARPAKEQQLNLENIRDNDKIILIHPGETILAHTQEFIGGRESVTTMMKARSSMGRNFIEVCKCAGWGDIGYVNRWTMEITNNSAYYTIPLVVGRRIAQIVFFDTDGTVENRSYVEQGKYQQSDDLDKLVKEWTPYSCLPQMYNDRECFS